jgi:hypothetical protein
MARIGHFAEITIGGEVAMIRIGDGWQGGAVSGMDIQEAEVSDDDEPATWIPWTALQEESCTF